jgi:trk system potassium uptake protein TrkH
MFRRIRNALRLLSPIQLLLIGFILLTLAGAFVLMLPIANANGRSQSFLDALFMATSAISTTGLGVVSLSHYTLLGQLTILLLIQVGGMGYMTLILFVIFLLGQRVSYHSGTLMQESLPIPSRGAMRSFVRRVVALTLTIELLGAVALTLFWLPELGLLRAIYYGLFHAISAFCTAGFSLFDAGFVAYRSNWVFNLIIGLISYAGAIGFFVLSEMVTIGQHWVRRKQVGPVHRISLHSKLAFWMTLALMGFGTAVLWLTNPQLTDTPGSSAALWTSFQAITAVTTTGFNTVDIAALSTPSLFTLTTLMFVGAPTGGTGGGIKSTTLGVILLMLWTVLNSNQDLNAFGRRISQDTLVKSMAITMTATFWLIFAITLLTITETGASFLGILFETASALGTVGLSVGLSSQLTAVGKIIFVATMFIGRVGPLTVMFSLVGKPARQAYRYPEEQIFVG